MFSEGLWAKARALLFSTLLLLLGAISHISGYSWEVREGYLVTYETATMLTPWGIIQNLVLTADHALGPYYFELPERAGFREHPVLLALIASASIGAWVCLSALRSEEIRRR